MTAIFNQIFSPGPKLNIERISLKPTNGRDRGLDFRSVVFSRFKGDIVHEFAYTKNKQARYLVEFREGKSTRQVVYLIQNRSELILLNYRNSESEFSRHILDLRNFFKNVTVESLKN